MGNAQHEATPEELKAMANPLRLRILRLCLHEAMTNKEVADRLGKDPATTLHHVRMLVRTGFLAAEPVRSGDRGALEKPYRATGKSWNLRISRPEDQATEMVAVLDAVREEMLEAGPEQWLTGARLGLRLSEAAAAELTDRIEALVQEYAARPGDPDGVAHGLYVNLHRLA